MTTQSLASYPHHAALKQENYSDRSTSPTVATSSHMQECAMTPAATSLSSDSSPGSAEHAYSQHYAIMAPPPVTSSYMPVPTPSAPQESHPPPASSWGGTLIAPASPESTSSRYPYNKNEPPSMNSKQKTVITAKKRYNKAGTRGASTTTSEKGTGDSVNARRQKRLERNRESARLSRRRRKQYLEVLEERVTQLSLEVDQGRRDHAKKAIDTILQKRAFVLENQQTEEGLAKLDVPLNRQSQEMLVVSTFQTQQLKSFSLPAQNKFVLWLTLQGDTYFRGGRAASERLSAARIGERVSLASFRIIVRMLLEFCILTEVTDVAKRKRPSATGAFHVAPFLQ